MDLEAARTVMVDTQVRANDVTDKRLIAAMLAVPREVFAPANRRSLAYAEVVIETGPGRAMVAPRDFSKLINAAAVKDTDKVLDIAPGAGYSTAIFTCLTADVLALEQDETAVKALADSLSKAGVSGAETIFGLLKLGAPAEAPFDVIFVNGAVEDVPRTWLDQLAEGGRLVVVVAEGPVRRARVYTRSGGKTAWRTPFECAVPALPGFERAAEFRL